MATTSRLGVGSSPAASPHRQCSPSVVRNAALGLPGVIRFWSPNPGINHGRQTEARLTSGLTAGQKNLEFSYLSPQLAPSSRNRVPAPREAPSHPEDSGIQSQSQADQRAQLTWRSMTPMTFLYNTHRHGQTRQAPPHLASLGPRAASRGGSKLEGQPVQNHSYRQLQASHLPTAFWHGAWAQPAERSQRPVTPQQHPCSPVMQLTKPSGRLASPAGAVPISDLQSSLIKLPGGRSASAASSRPTGAEQAAIYHPQRSALDNSPRPQNWRPLSVPPQGYSGLRRAGMPSTSASWVLQRADLGTRPLASSTQGPARMQGELKTNRSVSTPPQACRQSAGLASRLWSFFRPSTEHKEEDLGQGQSQSSESQFHWHSGGHQLASPTHWVYTANKNQQLRQQVGAAKQWRFLPGQPVASSAPRPPSPSVMSPSLISSLPTSSMPLRQKQEPGPAPTWSVSSGGLQAVFQPESCKLQGITVQLSSKQHPGPQYSPQQHMAQQYGSNMQREQFLWQQQQLLQRQREVLQQQKEKLIQQQASWQQQRQRSLGQGERQAQVPTQAFDNKVVQAPPTATQIAGNAEREQTGSASAIPDASVSSNAQLAQKPEAFTQNCANWGTESPHTEQGHAANALRSQEQPNNPTGSTLHQQPTAPPPLSWKLSDAADGAAASPDLQAPTDSEARKLNFVVVGGNHEQRMQLKCEVIGDLGASCNTPALESSRSYVTRKTAESKSATNLLCSTEGRAGSPREHAKVRTPPPEPAENHGPKVLSTADLIRTSVASDFHAAEVQGDQAISAAAKETFAVAHAENIVEAEESQLAIRQRGTLQQRVQPVLSCRSRRRSQERFKVGPHDLIPVGPLVAAITSAFESGKDNNECFSPDECTEDASYIESFLPIKSLAELESVEKGQKTEDLLDLRRDVVGCGTYGVVRKLRHRKGGFLVAVKSIQKETVVRAGMVNQVEFELYVQRDLLRHQNVLRCFSCVEDAEYLHMVLGYCEQGDLYRRIRQQPNRRFTELEAFCFFAQLVNGLQCVHSSGVIHRDLKLENLLLTKGNVLKIADFGWCGSVVGRNRSFSFCGTLDYLAPEMVKGQGHDWRVDLWSLGILLYELLDGRPPFQSTRHFELIQRIVTVDIRMPSHVKKDAADLIRKLLKYDPSERLPLVDVAQHPWVLRMWKELQLHLLQLDPTVDLEALVPVTSVAKPEVTTLLAQSRSSSESSCAQASHRTADAARASTGTALTKGLGTLTRNGAPRNVTRSPVAQSAGGRPSNLPPINAQRGLSGLYLDALPSTRSSPSISTERTGKKGAVSSRNTSASLSTQSRRRTLQKTRPSLMQTRMVRSTSRAPGNTTFREILPARCSETADASVADSATKKNTAKWRLPFLGQKNRGRTARLVDQSFDLPDTGAAEETCKSTPRPPQGAQSTSQSTGECGGNHQIYRSQYLDAGCVLNATTRNNQQCMNPKATCLGAEAHSQHEVASPAKMNQLPLRAGVTFCLDQKANKEASQPTYPAPAPADECSDAVHDATALPSLKKLRSVSVGPRSYGPSGAVLRMRSSPNRPPDGGVRVNGTASPQCYYPDEGNNQGMQTPGYANATVLPRICEKVGCMQGVYPDSFNAYGASPTSTEKAMSMAQAAQMKPNYGQHPRWPAGPAAHRVLPNPAQLLFQQADSLKGQASSRQFQCFSGQDSASMRWYYQLAKGQLPAYQTPQANSFWPRTTSDTRQKQRLEAFIADFPQRLPSPSQFNILQLQTTPPQPKGSPGHYLSAGSTQPNKSPQAASDWHLPARGMLNTGGVTGLPVVFGMQRPCSPKFLSNPNSLFR